VIKLKAAGRAVEDTAAVELERNGVGFEGYRDWALSDGSLKSDRAIGSDI
jgi:hypothetical protein